MTHIELAAMPVAERIRLMETLWESLDSEDAATAAVPDWHREVLAVRGALLDRDEEASSTLEEAKQRIRNLVGER